MFFLQWCWRRKCRRFLSSWSGEFPYQQPDLVDQLIRLGDNTPESFYQHIDQAHTQMVVYHGSIGVWLKESSLVIDRINKDQIRREPSLNPIRCSLHDFCLTEDSHFVEYRSAIDATRNQLMSLYQAVLRYPDVEKQQYFYRQVKEVFLTGIHFYLTLYQPMLTKR